MLETLHVHQPEHPGFPGHPLEGRKVGVDGGRGPAGVTQQLGDGHDVMTPQAAPAAGIQGGGAEHAGNNIQERGHGLAASRRIKREQVGPGRTDRRITGGRCRQETLSGRKKRRRQDQVRFIIRHQCHQGSVRAGNRPARCVKNRGQQYCQSVPQKVYFFKRTF